MKGEKYKQRDFEGSRKGRLSIVIGIVGVVMMALTIIVMIIIYAKSSEFSELTFRGLERYSLVDINKDVYKDMNLHYKNNKIKNLTRYTYEIVNTGTEAIDGDRVREEVVWYPPKNGKILSADVIDLDPDNAGQFLRVENRDSLLVLKINILNKDMRGIIDVMVADAEDNETRVEGAIVGADIIDKSNEFGIVGGVVEGSEPSLKKVFRGGLGVNFVRFLIFGFAGSILFFGSIGFIIFFNETLIPGIKKRRTKKRLEETEISDPTGDISDLLVRWAEFGDFQSFMKKLLKSGPIVKREEIDVARIITEMRKKDLFLYPPPERLVSKMEKAGLIERKAEGKVVFTNKAIQFVEFLKREGYLRI